MSTESKTAQIQLTKGYTATVDASDAGRVNEHKWYAETPRNRDVVYAARNVQVGGKKKIQYLHAFISGLGFVDHANGNGLDNRRENLRQASPSQNASNAPMRKDNTSGFKGVSYCKQTCRWQVRISSGGKERHVGRYNSPEEAAAAYDTAARDAHGEFARLNFPQPGERPARKAE